jgi:exosortase
MMQASRWRWLPLGAAIALAALYAPAVTGMIHLWRTDTYAGHGMFVPLFSTVIAWTERERLRRAAGPGHLLGAAVVLAGAGLLALGTAADSVLLQGASVAVTIAGLVAWACGLRCLRAAAFPIAFLLLMAPLPRSVVAAVTLQVQLFAAAFAVGVLRLLDLPVYQAGVSIELPSMTLQVAEACNGLRFLMALLVLTAAFAQITQRTVADKAALVVAAIPIAIVANAMRVAAIVLGVQYVGPDAASGMIHNWIGKGMWGLTLVPLIGLGFLLARRSAPKARPLEEGIA